MKALFTVPGPTGGIFEFRDIPTPTPGAGEALIKVHASGTNRGELLARPLLRSDNPALRPTRSGGEFAGEVTSLGEGASSWKIGDRVMGRAIGSYAEYTVANERALMRIPNDMGWAEAASIPNVFVTAHDAIVTNAQNRRGESVMITAGSSGVGTAAIQIARHLGANLVIATSRSASKIMALRELGAHAVIETIMEATGKRGVDVI